jgi:hypothetical protein
LTGFLPAGFSAPVASAATTATTARTVSTAAASEAVTPATTTAPRSRFTRARFVDSQSPAAEIGAVESGHSLVRIRIIGHFHESKTSRLPCIPILYDLYPIHLSIR